MTSNVYNVMNKLSEIYLKEMNINTKINDMSLALYSTFPYLVSKFKELEI
jgi:hypothetical protein